MVKYLTNFDNVAFIIAIIFITIVIMANLVEL